MTDAGLIIVGWALATPFIVVGVLWLVKAGKRR